MATASPRREIVEQLAEDFVERYRRGERPPLSEYTQRYPEHAEQIRDLFPALVMMEQIAPDSQGDPLPASDRSPRQRSGEPPNGSAIIASCARSAAAAWVSSTRPSRSRWAAGWP
jgi:hypothetical protein